MEIPSRHVRTGRLIVGGTFISLGILFLLMNMELIEGFPIWKFWPAVLIVIGINKWFEPYHRAEGFWLVSLGIWFQVSLLRVFGGFHYTWPAVLILLGIFWMWESFERESRKRNNEAQLHSSAV